MVVRIGQGMQLLGRRWVIERLRLLRMRVATLRVWVEWRQWRK
jgi:hypothetical protein